MSYNTFTVDFLYVMMSKYFQTRGYQKKKKKEKKEKKKQRKNKDRIQKRTCKKTSRSSQKTLQ